MLVATDGADEDRLGTSVAILDTLALVGAPRDDDAGGLSGSAYLFNPDTGGELHKLTANDAQAGDQLGFSASLDDGIAMVGAPFEDESGGDAGAAYLFDTSTGSQITKLRDIDAVGGEQLGYSVAMGMGWAVAGALTDEGNDPGSGAAVVFEEVLPNQWTKSRKLAADDPTGGDLFGWSIDLDGTTALVGGPRRQWVLWHGVSFRH